MHAREAETVLRHPDLLGEAPAYDAANERLLWVDIFGKSVRELVRARSGWEAGHTWEVGRLVSAVVPRAGRDMLLAAGTDFLFLSDDGEVETFASVDGVDPDHARFNDAKCDPQGRFLAGWMAHDVSGPGELVRLVPDGSVEVIMRDVGLANGLDWSPDGDTFYYIDTVEHRIDGFDWDKDTGRIGNRRPVVATERTLEPNGMVVDDEGCLWVALPWAGEVRRYTPAGELADTVRTPTLVPTSCAFGGPARNELFITSAYFKELTLPASIMERVGITADQIEAARRDEAGGGLFVSRPGVTGPPATPFAG